MFITGKNTRAEAAENVGRQLHSISIITEVKLYLRIEKE